MNLLDFIPRIHHPLKENPGHRDAMPPLAFLIVPRGQNRSSRLFFAALIIPAIALFFAQAALADETLLRGPRKTVRTSVEPKERTTGKQDILEEIASAPVLFYQRFLRPHWGHRCAYHPSCSNYALLAIRKHGALFGSMMTFDRLQHEADEARTSPLILTGGQIKIHDPLENNDYWWYTRSDSRPVSPMNGKQ